MSIHILRPLQLWRERRQALAEYNLLETAEQDRLASDENNLLRRALNAIKFGNFLEAQSHWEQACKLHPKFVLVSKDSIEVMLDLKLFDEAEVMMIEGQKRWPNDPHYATGYAKVAQRKGAKAEAVKRWAVVRRKFPYSWVGYAEGAGCLHEVGLRDKAETLIALGMKRFPDRVECVIQWARFAESRKDWNGALERWQFIVSQFRHLIGTLGVSRALCALDRVEEARALLSLLLQSNPRDLEVREALARIDQIPAADRSIDTRRVVHEQSNEPRPVSSNLSSHLGQ